MGAFPTNFQWPLAAKLLIASKMLWGAKMGRTSSITMPSMVGIVGRAPAVNEKVWCFFFVCIFMSRFRITKFVITETPWSSVIFKTIIIPLHTGRFLVVHLYSSFSMEPMDFFLGANLYQKLLFFCDFGGRKATFLKPRRWKLAWLWGLGRSSPTPNFVKIYEGDIPLWGKYLPKITNFSDFSGCMQAHIYKAKAVKFGVRVRTWDSLPQAKFCRNFLRGIPLFGIFV